MDIDFIAHVEQTLDNFGSRITALEEALIQLPAIEMQPDPSRAPGVTLAPEPQRVVPNG